MLSFKSSPIFWMRTQAPSVSSTNNARRIDDALVLFSRRCLEKKFLRGEKVPVCWGRTGFFLHGGMGLFGWVGGMAVAATNLTFLLHTLFYPNLQREIKRAMIQCDAFMHVHAGDACQSCGLDVKVAPNTPLENHAWRGVSYDRDAGKGRSRIYCLGKFVTLGRFRSSEDAAMCHDMAAYYIHGERALTNHELCAVREFYQSGLAFASSNVKAMLSVLKQAAKAGRDAGLLVRCNVVYSSGLKSVLVGSATHVGAQQRNPGGAKPPTRRLQAPPLPETPHTTPIVDSAANVATTPDGQEQRHRLRLVVLAAVRL
jgi:hypothetical protein